MYDELPIVISTAAQVVGKSLLGGINKLRQRATAQVKVDTDDTTATNGKRRAKITRNKGLTRTWIKGGQHDNLTLLFGIGHEL